MPAGEHQDDGSPVIRAEGLYKVFGRGAAAAVEHLERGADREALRARGWTAAVIDASFEVAAGEIFVVMGLSGSGKSTLIRMVNGLLTPTAGTMQVGDRDVASLSPKELRRLRQERISMVFQHFALFPHRTVGENAAYGLEVRGVSRADREAAADEALRLVGLDGWGASLPGELSGGMRQRVGLARALATGTDIMLMDEAFSALDPLIRREMQDQLVDIQDRLGTTVVFITHDLNEAMRLGDRIAMMRDGRIVQIGTAEQILNDPANDYVAQFIQDVDRSRVLTAASVMERPVALLGREQGPRAAHKLIRENQLGGLFVVDRHRRLVGVVQEQPVSDAVRRGEDDLHAILEEAPGCVHADTLVADLLAESAQCPVPLCVIDDDQRLLGVIPRVTLLNALSQGATAREPLTPVGEDEAPPPGGPAAPGPAALGDAAQPPGAVGAGGSISEVPR